MYSRVVPSVASFSPCLPVLRSCVSIHALLYFWVPCLSSFLHVLSRTSCFYFLLSLPEPLQCLCLAPPEMTCESFCSQSAVIRFMSRDLLSRPCFVCGLFTWSSGRFPSHFVGTSTSQCHFILCLVSPPFLLSVPPSCSSLFSSVTPLAFLLFIFFSFRVMLR